MTVKKEVLNSFITRAKAAQFVTFPVLSSLIIFSKDNTSF